MQSTGRAVLFVILCFAVPTASIADAVSDPRKLTLDEARELGMLAVNKYFPGVFLESLKPFVPEYYAFIVLSDSPDPDTSPHVGGIEVNTSTGDVWNMAGFCRHLTSPALKKRQNEIRRRFKFTPQEYKRLQAAKPFCDAE